MRFAEDVTHGAPPPDTREMPEPSSEPASGDRLEPTRYGDWECKGRCIDFWVGSAAGLPELDGRAPLKKLGGV